MKMSWLNKRSRTFWTPSNNTSIQLQLTTRTENERVAQACWGLILRLRATLTFTLCLLRHSLSPAWLIYTNGRRAWPRKPPRNWSPITKKHRRHPVTCLKTFRKESFNRPSQQLSTRHHLIKSMRMIKLRLMLLRILRHKKMCSSGPTRKIISRRRATIWAKLRFVGWSKWLYVRFWLNPCFVSKTNKTSQSYPYSLHQLVL